MRGSATGALVGMTAASVLAAGVLASCAGPAGAPALLRLRTAPDGPDTRLTLLAAPGLEINARLLPALELPNGTVYRFTTGRRSADSAYFAEPPSARLPGRHDQIHGMLRASVCRQDELVCHSVALKL
jgi:hypothetical protein